MSILHYYKPQTVLSLSVFNLFSIIFVHYEEQKEYRAFIQHNQTFITSDPDLEKLKEKVEEYLLGLSELIINAVKKNNEN